MAKNAARRRRPLALAAGVAALPFAMATTETGFCGRSLDDAKMQCRQPCQTRSDCCDPLDECFDAASSCAADFAAKAGNYCGTSWCDAADTCGRACPGGRDSECGFGETCFRRVPCDGTSNLRGSRGSNNNDGIVTDAVANFLSLSAMGGSRMESTDPNPNHFFCGYDPADAADKCIPCPGGKMTECGDGFKLGCFMGVSECAGKDYRGGNNNNSNYNSRGDTSGGTSGGTMSDNNGNNDVSSNMVMNQELGNALSSSLNVANSIEANMNAIVDEYLAATNNFQGDSRNEQLQAGGGGNSQTNNPPQTNNDDSANLVKQLFADDFDDTSNNDGGDANPGGGQANAPGQNRPRTASPTLAPSLPPWTNAPFVPTPSSAPKTVIGYYASWQWYDRDKFADPVNVDFSKYDRINYAFFQPDEDGRLFGTDEWGDPQLLWGPFITDEARKNTGNEFCSWDGPDLRNCNHHDVTKGIIYRAHAAGAEVVPSIGGWTLSDNFPGIAASFEKRDRFAQQCVDLIDAYGFDGIDLDWEYPGYEEHSGTPEDTVNFTLLLRTVRTRLDALGRARGRTYVLTAALPCGPDKIEDIEVDQITDVLTELNLMSYDLHGAWDKLTGVNAPMFDQGWTDTTPRWSVHGCVNNYVERGVPLSKINVGLPFFGRSFQGATGMKQFHGGTDDVNWHLDEGTPQYFNIVRELSRMTTYRHEKTRTQYASFNRGGGVVSYDDPRAICDKVAYANERGLHGFLIWEISGDMIDLGGGNMLTPLIDATNAKINDPNLDCSQLRDPLWALNDARYRYAPDEPDSVDWSQYVEPTSTGSGNDFDGAQGSIVGGMLQPVDDCPLSYTGMYASSECRGYVFCQDGEVVGASQPCVPGTLFDVTIGVCQWESLMNGCSR